MAKLQPPERFALGIQLGSDGVDRKAPGGGSATDAVGARTMYPARR
jgi:hypothetical protein